MLWDYNPWRRKINRARRLNAVEKAVEAAIFPQYAMTRGRQSILGAV